MSQHFTILGSIIQKHQIKPGLESPLRNSAPEPLKHVQVTEDKQGVENRSRLKETEDS